MLEPSHPNPDFIEKINIILLSLYFVVLQRIFWKPFQKEVKKNKLMFILIFI